MHKKGPRQHRRRSESARFEQRKRFLIVHNGRVTEEELIQLYKEQFRRVILKSKFNSGSIDDAILKAIELAHAEQLKGDGFDYICVIGDVDNYSIAQLRSFVKHAAESGVILLLSNPCIEVWLGCYFGNISNAFATISGAQQEAGKKDLITGKHINKELLKDYQLAIKVAEKLREKNGTDIITSKPSTDIDLFVKELLHSEEGTV
ncbi:RloB domain-containing protein [Candidatus Saccharibacteria bacterium]|nr:RloB domain-containing protein [Candidatus Saccharibacteria bacterium]